MPSSSASPDPVPFDPAAHGASYYELLQMPPTASPQQLRQSFRRLSKCYHPDTTSLPAPVAEQAFQQLQRAYAVLSDPQARQLYDERLKLMRAPSPDSGSPGAPSPTLLSRPTPVSLRRALSGGEWFALLLLAVALVLSLVLGIGVAWARGAEMMRWPSWWTDLHPAAMPQDGTPPGMARGEPPLAAPLMADADHVPTP
jgi:hypothetical protein